LTARKKPENNPMNDVYTIALVSLFAFLVYIEIRYANRNGKS